MMAGKVPRSGRRAPEGWPALRLACRRRQGVMAPPGASPLTSWLLRWGSDCLRFFPLSSQHPTTQDSFLYLRLSGQGILYECAFLQKHRILFVQHLRLPEGQKPIISPVWQEWLCCDIASHFSSLFLKLQSNCKKIARSPSNQGQTTCFTLSPRLPATNSSA